jgi:hypothetical protein
MDLITDLPKTTNGKDSIVVFVDRLSKMMHAVATMKNVWHASMKSRFLSIMTFPIT